MVPRPLPARAAVRTGTQTTAFGLDIQADVRLTFLEGGDGRPTARRLTLRVHPGAARSLVWPRSTAVICSRRGPDGDERFRIDCLADGGYLVWGRGRGSYRFSRAGRRLDCAPGCCAAESWERFLVGQVLPFASLLRGYEIFHASGVVIRGDAIALAGASGAGKTTLALALCEGGASFLADDVLALEPRAGVVYAHPGAPLAGIAGPAAARLSAARPAALAQPLARAGAETLVRMKTAEASAPLNALFLLDRHAEGPTEPCFEPVSASAVLASTFNFALETPERLLGLLDVCALIAQRRVERISAARSLAPDVLARAIVRRLGQRE